MALRFMDGFDWTTSTNDIPEKWDSDSQVITSTTATRFNIGRAVTSNTSTAFMYKTLDAQATWILGFAFYLPSTNTNVTSIARIYDSTTVQSSLYHNASRQLEVRLSTSSVLATGMTLNFNQWYFIEWQITTNNSGSSIVRVDGVETINFSATDTQSTANAYGDKISLTPGNNDRVDDVYVCDTSGTTNNTFLGDVRVSTSIVNGNGNSSQFTGSDGNSTDNYLLVDDTTPDDDSTYTESETVGHVDLMTVADLTVSPTQIFGVQVNAHAKRTDVTARGLENAVRSGGTKYNGTEQALQTGYRDIYHIWEQNPATSTAWTESTVNALEIGHEVAS